MNRPSLANALGNTDNRTNSSLLNTFLSSRQRFASLVGTAILLTCGTSWAQQFTDVSVEAGLHRQKTRSWGNPLWGDFNNDGLLDLFVSNHETQYGVPAGDGLLPYIYINQGDSTFMDVISTSGIKDDDKVYDTGAWQGASIADYDGDGNLDIMITEPPYQGGGLAPTRDILYKGHGDATWEYVSEEAGIVVARDYGECAFFVDYDNDGFLDIFVKNIPNAGEATAENVLYHNNGDGTFNVVPGAGGLADAIHGITEGSIVSFADYDYDGYMDVVMGGNGSSEALYHNNRDGTFTDVTGTAGLLEGKNTQGLAWGDFNNDGLLDLYISRGKSSGGGTLANSLYQNNGDGTFTDVGRKARADDGTSTWAAVWGDYDNDGFLDLFVARSGTDTLGPGNANILYHNNGDGTFTDVAKAEGVDQQDDDPNSAHKLAAWGDYDGDGFLDLATKDGIGPGLATEMSNMGYHYLFHNNGGTNHYLKLNLKGVQSNLNGLGARVTVTYGDGTIAFRENNGGGGGEWGSQGAGPMHFGIGTADTATVRITWPSGLVDLLSDVAANSTLTVVEGSSPPPVLPQNISTRLDVETGENVGIGGFIVTGTSAKKILIRGIGPSLASTVSGFLPDPVLELHRSANTTLTNDDWKTDQQAEIAATGLAPTNDSEAAMVVNLIPGPYTAVLRGANGTTGVGLIEVYDLDQGDTSELANVSTRGFVGSGDNVMIGGVIIGPNGAPSANVVVRAIGPSLADLNVDGVLQDPTLDLFDANGTIIGSDDNWQDNPTQANLIKGAGIAPTDPRESAIYKTLATGSYTAIVRGSGGTTGVGLVEVYNVK